MLGSLAIAQGPLRAQDHDHDDHDHDHPAARVYVDREHGDKHEWNDHEATTWNSYRSEHHVRTTDFDRASKRQQQAYWNWRHEHPDEQH